MICTLCDGELVEFLDLGQQPMANKYPLKGDFSDEEFYPLKMCYCPSCKNTQLDTFVSREKMFIDYYYLSSVNAALVKHYEDFAHTLGGSKFVVDAGSNDGVSLRPLKEMGIKCLGVEPSINISKIANDAGLETMAAFLDTESVSKIVKEHGKADVVTGFSMFSHLKDPHQFIEDVKNLMTDDGRFIVEVEYIVSIMQKMAFERFYLDHTFCFSVTSLDKLFQMHDMYLADAEVTAIHGGSLRVTAKKGTGRTTARVRALLKAEKSLTSLKLKTFGYAAKKHVQALKNKLIEYKNRGLHVAGYGAPARLSTITNFGDIGPDLIDFVVDDSPLKQNRYSPGKHIPIVSAEYLKYHHPDVLVVFAYDYFKEIKKSLTQHYRFLFPIPPREVK